MLAAALCAAGLFQPSDAAAQANPPAATLPPVQVIGTSPLPGQGVDRDLLPYATQSLRRGRLDDAKSDNLSDFMNRQLPGVQVNDIQGSPFQGDLTFRGFRASPLLGASQGLSVYLDGVRINEPFGDVVNWDLLPEFAIDSLTLVPGANPAFGLNTLGGALSFTTYSGLTAPGLRAEVSAGSFGRRRVDLSYGRAYDSGWHSFIAATAFDERGWRDQSAGRLGNLLLKLGHSSGDTDWDFSLLLGHSRLVGNGLVPAYTLQHPGGGGHDDDEEGGEAPDDEAAEGGGTAPADPPTRVPDLYAARRQVVYTYPDRTTQRLAQAGLRWRHSLDAQTQIDAVAYLRRTRRATVSGDAADEPSEDANAAFNTTATRQDGHGAALALSGKTGPHQWQVGGTVDASRTHYEQFEQAALFTADRGVIAGETPAEMSARVSGRSTAFGVYGTDTLEIAERTHVTGTLRFNHARVGNQLGSVDDASGEFVEHPNETFTYRSLNPALGVAHRLDGGPTLFANVARNTRVPTVIELGCADPEQPCRLPAGLQSDPYLKPVRSTTAELGLRWPLARGTSLSFSAFRTENRDDILFRSVSVTGQQGYFQNFERTRYQGADVELQTTLGSLDLRIGYSHLEATYQAAGVLRIGERNVAIEPGTRIAGLPRHALKLAADWRAAPGLTLGADLQASSRRVTSGNEDGYIEDGATEKVDVSLPGYAIVNLRASWRPDGSTAEHGWELYAKVNNAFDRRYANFAALADTVFDAEGRYTGVGQEAVFVAPGAPRSVTVGLRYRY